LYKQNITVITKKVLKKHAVTIRDNTG